MTSDEKFIWDVTDAANALPVESVPFAAALLSSAACWNLEVDTAFRVLALLSARADIVPTRKTIDVMRAFQWWSEDTTIQSPACLRTDEVANALAFVSILERLQVQRLMTIVLCVSPVLSPMQ